MSVVTQEIQDQVSELYIAFFNRAPDADGFGYWAQELASGRATVEQVAAGFGSTPEFIGMYGGLNPEQQVTRLYNNVLNRAPDEGGLQFWVDALENGKSITEIAWSIVNTAFTGGEGVDPADTALVQNKVTVAEYFAIELDSNDVAIARTAFVGVTDDEATVTAAEERLAGEVNPPVTYTLTTNIDTIPASGTMSVGSVVTGAVDVAGGSNTFQSGDTINGSVNGQNTLTINNVGARGANIIATVKNLAEIKHNLLANNAYDEALYSGVGEEYLTNNAAGATLTILNGELATVYGAKDATAASTLNVGIRASNLTGTANTLNLSVRNAGSLVSQAGVAPVVSTATINATSNGVETISLATTGTNILAITDNPAAGVATDYAKFVVTGDGANTMTVAALTQARNYDLSASTGANTLRFDQALQSNTTIVGGNAADTVRVDQNTVVAGISLTGVETLRSATGGSTGTIAFTTSSLTTLRVDGDTAETGRLSLVAPGSMATINYVGDALTANAAAPQQFKAVTITGAYSGAADAVAVNIGNSGVTQLAGYNLNAGAVAGAAILANGIETLTVNVNDIAATGTTTFTNGIASSSLQSITFTSAGAVNAGVINAAPAAGNSALTSVNLSGITSTAASTVSFVGVESVGAATQIVGPAGTGALTINTGLQGNTGTQADTLIVTGGGGNTTINANALANNTGAAFDGTLTFTGATAGVTNTLTVGDGAGGVTTSTTIATFSGAGSTNNITGGNGVDTITVSATGLGSTNTVTANVGADVVNASGSTVAVTLNGNAGNDTLTGGAGNDTINGGADVDNMTGGSGSNTFRFAAAADVTANTPDVITDFDLVATNILSFDAGVAPAFELVGGNALSYFEGTNGTFGPTANVVVITTAVVGALTSANAATAIGNATAAYGVGDGVLFLVSNNTDSAVFKFTSAAADNTVTAAELGAGSIISLTGVNSAELAALSAANFVLA